MVAGFSDRGSIPLTSTTINPSETLRFRGLIFFNPNAKYESIKAWRDFRYGTRSRSEA